MDRMTALLQTPHRLGKGLLLQAIGYHVVPRLGYQYQQ